MKLVQADSVSDYLDRYYKKNKRTATLVASYEQELESMGYICTSLHDNVLGEFICWPTVPAWVSKTKDRTILDSAEKLEVATS